MFKTDPAMMQNPSQEVEVVEKQEEVEELPQPSTAKLEELTGNTSFFDKNSLPEGSES